MNGHYVRALPSDELNKIVGEHWKSSGILTESEGSFVDVSKSVKLYLGNGEGGETDMISLFLFI